MYIDTYAYIYILIYLLYMYRYIYKYICIYIQSSACFSPISWHGGINLCGVQKALLFVGFPQLGGS